MRTWNYSLHSTYSHTHYLTWGILQAPPPPLSLSFTHSLLLAHKLFSAGSNQLLAPATVSTPQDSRTTRKAVFSNWSRGEGGGEIVHMMLFFYLHH